MTNSEIANIINTTSKLMALYGAQSFKIRSYENAFKSLRRWSSNLSEMTESEIASVGDIGPNFAKKVIEIIQTNSLTEYDVLKEKTPEGIIELLNMKGLGPKKLKQLWDELGIKKAEDLLFACRQNKLLALKGFGQKTQDALKEKLMFFLSMRGYQLFSTIEKKANLLISKLEEKYPNGQFTLTGKIKRKEQIMKRIDILHNIDGLDLSNITKTEKSKHYFLNTPISFLYTNDLEFGNNLIRTTGPESFTKQLQLEEIQFKTEKEVFSHLNINFIPAEIRHQQNILEKAKNNNFDDLVKVSDIKGSLHMHTTYSDGLNSLEEMVKYAVNAGYEYMLITDHSKSATYANGLQIERLLEQIKKIGALNNQYNIKIYSGIESDILSNGALDYPDEILAQLDIVISSVHSGLGMDINKATDRILKAIENPYTRIMGHLTGRLLTTREGYPVDHRKIIDACANTNTVMELNANPSRLDIDEQYIPYAMEKNVMISINPDAHSTSQLDMMQYGVHTARRGGLTKNLCLNTKSLVDFDKWVKNT